MGKKRKIPFIALVFIIILVLAITFSISMFRESIITTMAPGYGSSEAPMLFFENPTPANNIYPSNNQAEINISVFEPQLSRFTFNWDGASENYYDNNLILGLSLDYNPALGETSSVFSDFSSSGHNGTCSSSSCPTSTTGVYGNAAYFDGDDYITINDCNGLLSSQGTISFWFKDDTPTGDEDVLRIYENYQNFFLIRLNSQGGISVWIEDNDVVEVYANPWVQDSLKDGKWHHLIVTQDGRGIRFFVDGIERKLTGNDGTLWTSFINPTECRIGRGGFQGSIDEVRIYNRAWGNETVTCEGYGAESYPYTQTIGPIGGGPGYKNIINRNDADYVVDTKSELESALNNAQPGQIIYVEDYAQIDLSGWEEKPIHEGIILASGRGREISPGVYSQGALLYSNNQPRCLFWAHDHVRVTGLRFDGKSTGASSNACAIHLARRYDYGTSKLITYDYVEIDNNEIVNWDYYGIWNSDFYLDGGLSYIHHNNIHHVVDSARYGIAVVRSNVLAEANTFSYIGHDVTDAGYYPSTYEARYNIFNQFPERGQQSNDVHGHRDFSSGVWIGFWNFDEGSGNKAYNSAFCYPGSDQSNEDCTLTNMNTATSWTSNVNYEHFDSAIEFDGTNDYLDCGNGVDFNDPIDPNPDALGNVPGDSKIYLEAWIKPYDPKKAGIQVIASKGNVGSSYSLYLNGNDDRIYFSIGSNDVSMSMPQGLQNQWHHVAGYYNKGRSELKLYYDGVEVASKSYNGNIAQNSNKFTVGAQEGGSNAFQGMIDEVSLFNNVRYTIDQTTYASLSYNGLSMYAGYYFNIHHNTYTASLETSGVRIRGRVPDRAIIYRNMFRQHNLTDSLPSNNAVANEIGGQEGKVGHVYTYDNCYIPLHYLSVGTFKKTSQDTWTFYFDQTKLAEREHSYFKNHTYYAWAQDTQGNSNYTHQEGNYYSSSNPRKVNIVAYVNPEVTLLSPNHGSYDADGQVTFTCNAVDGIYLENLTLQVWNNDGSVYYKNTRTFKRINSTKLYNFYDTESWQLTSMPEENYTWNCLAYNVGYYGDWGNMNNALFIGEEPAGYEPPEPEPSNVTPTEPEPEPTTTPPPAPAGGNGGGGGSYTPTTPVGETGVLPPLIEPSQEPEYEEPGEEELKGQVKEKELTLPRIEDISWQAWAIIGTSFLFIIYIIFIIAKKPI